MVDGQVYQVLTDLVRVQASSAAGVITRDMLAFFRKIQGIWPRPGADTSGRSTGYSWSRLALSIEQVGEVMVARIENDAFYSALIKQDAHSEARTYRRILFDPADQVTDDMAEAIATAMAGV